MPIIGIFTWILCHTAMSIIIWEFHFGCLFYGKDDIPSGWWCSNHLEKYEFVNGKDYPIYEMENKKCSKPPTREIYCAKNHDRMLTITTILA